MSERVRTCVSPKNMLCDAPHCEGCGFDPKEQHRRKQMIRNGELVQDEDGLRRLYIKTTGDESNV